MQGLRRLGVLITGWTFVLMMLGGYVKAIHAGLACPDWPTCYGQWLPPFVDATGFYTEHQIMAEWVHRFVASFLGPFLLAFAYMSWKDRSLRPSVRWTPIVALVVLAVQVVFGGLTVLKGLQPLIVTSHLGFATIFFGMMLYTTTALYLAPRRTDAVAADADTVAAKAAMPSEGAKLSARQLLADVASMMKLRVSFLLVLSAVTAMFLAQRGAPPAGAALAVVLGGILMVGGSGAINHWLERESDKLMERTASRPIPAGRIKPAHALTFGIVQGIAAFAILYHFTNLVAATFAVVGLLFYVFIYTILLKRLTPQNITIGGIAGGFPVLVGWTAVTGTVDLIALVFMLLIIVWTPPHFWALAILLKDDYSRAGIPMMPSVKGDKRTTTEMLVYAVLTVAVSLSFFFLDVLGRLYFFAACVLGGLFLAFTVDVHRRAEKREAKSLFFFSILYLGLLYVAMVADIGLA